MGVGAAPAMEPPLRRLPQRERKRDGEEGNRETDMYADKEGGMERDRDRLTGREGDRWTKEHRHLRHLARISTTRTLRLLSRPREGLKTVFVPSVRCSRPPSFQQDGASGNFSSGYSLYTFVIISVSMSLVNAINEMFDRKLYIIG